MVDRHTPVFPSAYFLLPGGLHKVWRQAQELSALSKPSTKQASHLSRLDDRGEFLPRGRPETHSDAPAAASNVRRMTQRGSHARQERRKAKKARPELHAVRLRQALQLFDCIPALQTTHLQPKRRRWTKPCQFLAKQNPCLSYTILVGSASQCEGLRDSVFPGRAEELQV